MKEFLQRQILFFFPLAIVMVVPFYSAAADGSGLNDELENYDVAFLLKKSKTGNKTGPVDPAAQQEFGPITASESPTPNSAGTVKETQPQTAPAVPQQEEAPPAQPEQPAGAVPPQAPEQPPASSVVPVPDAVEPAAQPRVATPELPMAPKVTAGRKGEVSFNFDDADVFSVIQTIFGDVLKVNYIVDPRVKGRVNFRSVAPVGKNDVLPLMEVILRLNGIGIVEEGGLYRIVPIGDLPKEPAPVGIGREAGNIVIQGKALLQIVPVSYISSSEMIRILTPFLSPNAVMVDVPKSNYIILVDTDANIKKLLQLVEVFDSEKLKKIKPHVFVYPVQNSKAKDVASMLQQIFLGARAGASSPPKTAAPQATPPAAKTPAEQPMSQPVSMAAAQMGGGGLVDEITRIIADEIQNSIIILATPEDYQLIEETVKKIDVVPRQVMIEALVASVELTDNMRFGLQWRIQNDITISGFKPFTRDISLDGPLDFAAKITNPTLTFTAFDNSGNVKLLVQALADNNKAKILSSPHILVSDNREARIQVGDQIPIATSTTTTPITGGTSVTNTTTSTIQYKDTGTILKVKPQVNDSGLVALELTQEVSKGKTIPILGTEQFQITKKEITTNLVVQDGQTIVIGGLIDETGTKGRSGIPFLSKIPLLGYLFGSTVDDFTRSELVILLTPRVIRNQQEARVTTSDYLDRFKGNTNLKAEEIIPEKKK